MNTHTHKSSTALMGSIAQIAHMRGQSEADAMLNATTVVAVDTSASMTEQDAGEAGNQERYEVACDQLAILQAARPGEVVVMSWSTRAIWDFDGVPTYQMSGTDIMAPINEFLSSGLDGLLNLTIIADGEVDEDAKPEAIKKVASMQSRVDTIFIGDKTTPDGKRAAAFLAKLARAGRGQHATTMQPGTLAAPMLALMPPSTNTTPGTINL